MAISRRFPTQTNINVIYVVFSKPTLLCYRSKEVIYSFCGTRISSRIQRLARLWCTMWRVRTSQFLLFPLWAMLQFSSVKTLCSRRSCWVWWVWLLYYSGSNNLLENWQMVRGLSTARYGVCDGYPTKARIGEWAFHLRKWSTNGYVERLAHGLKDEALSDYRCYICFVISREIVTSIFQNIPSWWNCNSHTPVTQTHISKHHWFHITLSQFTSASFVLAPPRWGKSQSFRFHKHLRTNSHKADFEYETHQSAYFGIGLISCNTGILSQRLQTSIPSSLKEQGPP